MSLFASDDPPPHAAAPPAAEAPTIPHDGGAPADPGAPAATRSPLIRTGTAVIVLAVCFGAGLAGGSLYRYLASQEARPAAGPATNLAAQAPVVSASASAPPIAAAPEKTATATPPEAPATSAAEMPAPPIAEAQAAPAPATETTPPPQPPVASVASEPPPAAIKARHATAERANPPPKATAVAHAPPAARSGPFRIQFGVFAHEDNARRVQWAVEASGLRIDAVRAPGPSGEPLFYLRSAPYPDYAAAHGAAQTVENRVRRFANKVPVEYVILRVPASPVQQAQAR